MNFFIKFSAGNKELNKGLNNLIEAEKNIVLAHSKHSRTDMIDLNIYIYLCLSLYLCLYSTHLPRVEQSLSPVVTLHADVSAGCSLR